MFCVREMYYYFCRLKDERFRLFFSFFYMYIGYSINLLSLSLSYLYFSIFIKYTSFLTLIRKELIVFIFLFFL